MGILQHVEHQISALNDLIKINNDRATGYQKAIESTEEQKLKKLFEDYIEDSKEYVGDLTEHLHFLGGDPASGTTLAGKFYHTWIDVKAKFSKKDNVSILSDCEYGEDVANTAYRNALDDKELIWKDERIVNILSRHLKELKATHDHIKELRDNAIALALQSKKVEKPIVEPADTKINN
ncbi:PA2169 family four-helix-bundle protein [Mucilaginibacter sp. L196]|uniref:ferritin-like domain-containing protein n=1 Tax=Mucilaginibacter sp. L196 TaxID=1641870 RepID=UPI00131D74FC|nr:PA2169 family four-helix-bundle protein [Mucilaginibacter sp. L196]